MAEINQFITIYKIPIVLYYDSIRALNRNRTQAGSWSQTGPHRVVNKVVQAGVTVYAINNHLDQYAIGWVREDDLGGTGLNEQTELWHTVVSGDTLWRIANQYGTTVANLRSWNNLKGDLILVGQRLIVRLGKTIIIEDNDGEVVETVPVAMTVEINGIEYDLNDGLNTNSGIKLPPGMTTVKVTGNGTIAFNYSHEVMG